jgi:hypothetical protein
MLENRIEQIKVVAEKIEDLPPLPEGFLRLVRLANLGAVEDIINKGLAYKDEGMISAATTAYLNEEDVSFSDDNLRHLAGKLKAVIFDVPAKEYIIHNNMEDSPGTISPEYIVGVVDVEHKNSN